MGQNRAVKTKLNDDEIRALMLEEIHSVDQAVEPVYEGLVALAAMICETPVAIISIFDQNRKWIKAKIGIEISQLDSSGTFGIHTMSHNGPMIVEDAAQDLRFAKTTLVTHSQIRFYAGIALKVDGVPLGTIAVMDHKPRTLTAKQKESLRLLGVQTETQFELRRTRSKLQDLNQRYESIMRTAMEGVIIRDSEERVVYVNGRLLEILGYDLDDVVGRAAIDFVYPEDHFKMADQIKRRRAGHSSRYEVRLMRKDRSPIWVLISGAPMFNSRGEYRGTMGVVVDITDRRNMEEELRSKEERLQKVLSSLQDAVWSVTLQNTRVLYANEALEHIYGRGIEEFQHNADLWKDCVPPEDRDIVDESHRVLFEKGTCQSEHRIVRPDGGVRWVRNRIWLTRDSFGKPFSLEGICSDITEQRIIADKLRASTNRFMQLAEHLNEMVWLSSLDGSEFQYVSAAADKIWGFPREVFYNDPQICLRVVCREDEERVAEAWRQMAANPMGGLDIKYRINHQDGTVRWLWTRAFPILDEHSLPLRACGLTSDITRQKQDELTIAEQKEKIIASSKMSALGEMASGIAHEINNPLAIIHLKAGHIKDLAQGEKIETKEIAEAAGRIEATAMRISKIVKSLRSFARDGGRDPFESVSVKGVVDETVEMCRERFKNHAVKLTVGEIPAALALECRSVQISQVLLNLLNNSFDAVAGSPEKWIRVAVCDRGQTVEISVEDGGAGVQEGFRDKIFQPFFTTKEVGKGTGLGLSVSRGIVESHQGTLRLDAASKCTRFVIELPKKQALEKSGHAAS